MAKNAVEDDEEVQELKSLIHQQKNSRLLQQQQQQPQPQQLAPPQQQQQLSFEQQTPSPMNDIKQQQQRSLANDYQQYTNADSWQQDSPAYNTYDYDNEYDDNWTHWDSKRNVQPKKLILPTLISTTTTTTMTTAAPTTPTTEKPKVEIVQGPNGQKEVVLPRPASPVRNPFANVIPPRPQVANMAAHQAKTAGLPSASSSSSSGGASVYDTIKKIINMQQNLEDAELRQQLDSQRHKGARINKRFVSTAESLVQQLDGLKRTA